MRKLVIAVLSVFSLTGCYKITAHKPALEATKQLDDCEQDIRRLCENISLEQCEQMLPLKVWSKCAERWEAYAFAHPDDPEAPYAALEFLLEFGLRTPSYFEGLSALKRAIKIAEIYQKLFGRNALKKSKR